MNSDVPPSQPLAKRRNFTRLRRRAYQADVLFISFPKSGRTWLRTVWAAYWCTRAGIEFDLRVDGVAGMPRLYPTHDRWTHLLEASAFKRLLGHGLIPPRAALEKPKVLLVRDPRDIVVSLFFHMSRRGQVKRRFEKPDSVRTLVHHPHYGFVTLIDILNGWYEEWGERDDFKLVRYEDARADTARVMRDWFTFAGAGVIDEAALEHAIAYSGFDAARKREQAGVSGDRLISARNLADADSFKARRGKVGGFTDHLDPDDVAYCNAAMARLNPAFGYKP